jgi:hypothetical protein
MMAISVVRIAMGFMWLTVGNGAVAILLGLGSCHDGIIGYVQYVQEDR